MFASGALDVAPTGVAPGTFESIRSSDARAAQWSREQVLVTLWEFFVGKVWKEKMPIDPVSKRIYRWWFYICFIFTPTSLQKWSNLTD